MLHSAAVLRSMALVVLAASVAAGQEAYQVKDLVSGPSTGSIESVTAWGPRAVFSVADVDHGREPWRTDGTTAGTALVGDIAPGTASSFPGPFCATPGLFYFLGLDPAAGWEVFRSDGTEAGTRTIGDLTPGPSLGAWNLTCAGGLAFFSLDVPGGAELWRTDGTAAGTISLTGRFAAGPFLIRDVNGTVLFWASTDGSVGSLWRTDGTPSGTAEVRSFGTSSTPDHVAAAGSQLFFILDDGVHGQELWASDGTAAGTRLVKDIVPGPAYPIAFELQAVGSRVFFTADDLVNGAELFVSDGTDAGTRRIDLAPGPASLFPRGLVAYLGEAFFVTTFDATGTDAIWRSDGTQGGTHMVVQVSPSGSAFIRSLAPVKERLFFVAEDAASGAELWRTDGTAQGTALAADIWPGVGDSNPDGLVGAGRRLFMAADDGATGRELWAAPVSAFADVAPLDPFWRFIHALYDSGVTGGCAPAPLRYCPGQAVSREAMAVLLLRSKEGAGYTPPPCTAPGPFPDVPCSSPFAPWIEELVRRGVTGGCSPSPPAFCPATSVDRAQMAVLLLSTKEGPAYVPPACTTPTFGDVPCSSPFAPWIEELVRRGITNGCGGGNYCPASPVTRAQMAVFLSATFGVPLP
jgi:ELWxxDGT repeat protein